MKEFDGIEFFLLSTLQQALRLNKIKTDREFSVIWMCEHRSWEEMQFYQKGSLLICAILTLLTSATAYNVLKQPIQENELEQDIDSLRQDYLAAEENLWHLIRSTNDNNQFTTLGQIYDIHESYLAKRFSETGQFERFFNQLQINSNDLPLYTRSYAEMINDIRHINFTTNNVYQLLYHNQNERLPRIVEDIKYQFPDIMHKITKNVDENFWMFIKTVRFLFWERKNTKSVTKFIILHTFFFLCFVLNQQKCDKYTRIIYAQNHLLMLYYKEVVAALLKGYMSLQMSYMILTVNGISKFERVFSKIQNFWILGSSQPQLNFDDPKYSQSRPVNSLISDNYRHDGEHLRGRFRYNITIIQDEVREQMRNSSREMWACDPDSYVYSGKNFVIRLK